MCDLLLTENVPKFSGLDETMKQIPLFIFREYYSPKTPSQSVALLNRSVTTYKRGHLKARCFEK